MSEEFSINANNNSAIYNQYKKHDLDEKNGIDIKEFNKNFSSDEKLKVLMDLNNSHPDMVKTYFEKCSSRDAATIFNQCKNPLFGKNELKFAAEIIKQLEPKKQEAIFKEMKPDKFKEIFKEYNHKQQVLILNNVEDKTFPFIDKVDEGLVEYMVNNKNAHADLLLELANAGKLDEKGSELYFSKCVTGKILVKNNETLKIFRELNDIQKANYIKWTLRKNGNLNDMTLKLHDGELVLSEEVIKELSTEELKALKDLKLSAGTKELVKTELKEKELGLSSSDTVSDETSGNKNTTPSDLITVNVEINKKIAIVVLKSDKKIHINGKDVTGSARKDAENAIYSEIKSRIEKDPAEQNNIVLFGKLPETKQKEVFDTMLAGTPSVDAKTKTAYFNKLTPAQQAAVLKDMLGKEGTIEKHFDRGSMRIDNATLKGLSLEQKKALQKEDSMFFGGFSKTTVEAINDAIIKDENAAKNKAAHYPAVVVVANNKKGMIVKKDDQGRVLTMEKTSDGKYKVTYTYTTKVNGKDVIKNSSFKDKEMDEQKINKEITDKEDKNIYKPYVALLKNAKAEVDKKAEGATADNTPAKDTSVVTDDSKNLINEMKDKKKFSETKQGGFTTRFNAMNPADQAEVINAIMEDDNIDIEDVFVLENLDLKPATIGLVKNTERFLNIDSKYSANGIFGENYNDVTKKIIKTHIETINKAEDVKLEYSVSTIDERKKAVKKLEQELNEIVDVLDSNRLLPDQIRILKNKKAAIASMIKKIKIDIDTERTQITAASDDINKRSTAIKNYETALDDNGIVPDNAPDDAVLVSYADELQKSYDQMSAITAALGAKDNRFIADDDTNRWTAIANTLILLGEATKDELFGNNNNNTLNLNAIKAKLAKLAGKSTFGDVKSYDLAIRTLLVKINQKQEKIKNIQIYTKEYKKIVSLDVADDKFFDKWNATLKTIMAMPAGSYRDRLLEKFNEKLEELYRDTPKSSDLIAPALAKIKQVRAAQKWYHFDTSGSITPADFSGNSKVENKKTIINLYNNTANSYTPRGKAVHNITYLLAGGGNGRINDNDLEEYYTDNQGQLKFKKEEDHYKLIIKKDNTETTLDITITNEVAASFLGIGYVNLGAMSDSQIQNLLSIIVTKHQDTYKESGGKVSQSLEMKVAIGDMENWTNMTHMKVVDRATFRAIFLGGSRSYGSYGDSSGNRIYSCRTLSDLRTGYINRAKTLLNFSDIMDQEFVTAFIKGQPPYDKKSLFIYHPGHYDELIKLQNKLRQLNNDSFILSIGKPSVSSEAAKPVAEKVVATVADDIRKKTKDVKVINTGAASAYKQGDKLNAYMDELKKSENGYSIVEQNGKKSPFILLGSTCYVIKKDNKEYLFYEKPNKTIWLAPKKGNGYDWGSIKQIN